MNKARKVSSPVLDSILESASAAEIQKVHAKMALSVKIADALRQSGLSKSAFAEKLGKRPSEVTKWLGGTHNFTVDTLVEIAHALRLDMGDFFERQTAPAMASPGLPAWQKGTSGLQTPFSVRELHDDGQQLLARSSEGGMLIPYLA